MEKEVLEEEVSLFGKDGQPVDHPQPVEAEPPAEEEAPTFEVPEKFKDKSVEEVIKSYVNLEKSYGEKSNEVGELRKLTDQILLNQAQQQQPVPNQQGYYTEPAGNNDDVGLDDFINDPSEAVNKALSNNPTIKRMEQTIEAQEAQVQREKLLAVHPDADQIVASPEFQTWLNESPGRMQMLHSAHVNRNVDVANDMLNLYKATKVATNEEATVERDAKAAADLKAATVEGGSAGPTGSKKPIFKRKELIELKLRDPAKYESMRDIIHEAYAEKRVR